MSSLPDQSGDTATVVEMNDDQWREAVEQALGRLHLTYRELAEMAKRRDFSSIEAKKLWMSIGTTRA
ncbi:hypothetical protein [Micromonospora craniellae]|uniref:hypothetical protein n=1 Tax=Micromonospora craniellae TaxID=2294034 RepID=UPI000E3C4633|nr:hypothetical protein [Micromonospora craniellae]QOC95413.1 hypothetical protein ID554_24305 [Micromonospora craniellae]